MKQKFLKGTNFRLLICLLFLITAFIIHSCKKDSTNQSSATITNPVVSQAKQWYESTYPVTTTLNSKQTTQSVNQISNVPFDYTQHLKPDWQHAATYNRLGAAVIEIPLDPSSDKIASDFKDLTNNKVIYKQQYSRSTFLLLNYGTGYNAYIMTIIADSTYLKGNLSKLANNTYRKHDTDFSGVVMYSTPKGAFVSSFGYYNGKLLPPLSQNNTSGTQAVQSLSAPVLKPADAAAPSCVAWYLDTYVNGELISSDYLFTTCAQSGGGGGGGGENGGGAGTSPTPAPCIPPQSKDTNAVTWHLVIDAPIGSEPPPPADGGNPAPVNYCPTETIDLPDSTKTPCAQIALAVTSSAANAAQNTNILNYTTSTGIENGANQNLTSLTGDTYASTSITTGTDTSWTSTFTWDSTNGYTIGSSHGHPDGTVPSPDDVFKMIANLTNTTGIGTQNLLKGGASAIQFYRNNVSATVTTSNYTFVVTVNNWATLQTLYSQYIASKNSNGSYGFDNTFSDLSTDYQSTNGVTKANASAYALLSTFKDAINLYEAPTGSTDYQALAIASTNAVVKTPCP